MVPTDVAMLLAVAGLWGFSFLFMRVAAPVLGPLPLVAVRLVVASACLLPVALARGEGPAMVRSWRQLVILGVVNSAAPFALFAWATLPLPSGVTAVLNGTAPLFTAAVGWLWLRRPLGLGQGVGLALGFAGVAVLVAGRGGLAAGADLTAFAAATSASALYGVAANYMTRSLAGVSASAIAAGSLTAAAAILSPALAWLPAGAAPSAWACALGLGALCTGLAYHLYFRLVDSVGVGRAITVTFLVPAFALAWGAGLLHEEVQPLSLLGAAMILGGLRLALK